jgi:outer membrane protein TolC
MEVSNAALAVAEAQYQQAVSGRWPQLSLDITGTRRERDPDFAFPDMALNMGPRTVSVPGFDLKLMDRDLLASSLQLSYPLYTGGKQGALATQGRMATAAAQTEARRTRMQIVRDTTQYYYAAILARNLAALGEEALARLQATQDVAETLYQNGSGRVKKTDFLRTRVIVATLRSLVALLRSNQELACTALANAMGQPWNAEIVPAETEIPFTEFGPDLERLVHLAHALNPELLSVGYRLEAAQAGVDLAHSGHLPVVVLFATADRFSNAYPAGLVTANNRNAWTLGFQVHLPLFQGFQVTGAVREAKARVRQGAGEQTLLREGLAVQVKDAFLQIARSAQQVRSTQEALAAAADSRALNERAYREEMVETKDLIDAQLTELFIKGQVQQARYDARYHQVALEYLIGGALDDSH